MAQYTAQGKILTTNYTNLFRGANSTRVRLGLPDPCLSNISGSNNTFGLKGRGKKKECSKLYGRQSSIVSKRRGRGREVEVNCGSSIKFHDVNWSKLDGLDISTRKGLNLKDDTHLEER